jgi:hypothetical protein
MKRLLLAAVAVLALAGSANAYEKCNVDVPTIIYDRPNGMASNKLIPFMSHIQIVDRQIVDQWSHNDWVYVQVEVKLPANQWIGWGWLKYDEMRCEHSADDNQRVDIDQMLKSKH